MKYPNEWDSQIPASKAKRIYWLRQGPELFENQINWTCVRPEFSFPVFDLVTPPIVELHKKQRDWISQLSEERRSLKMKHIPSWASCSRELQKEIDEAFNCLYIPHKNEYLTAIQRQKVQDELELAEAHYHVRLHKEKILKEEKRLRIERIANEIFAAEKPKRRQAPPRSSQNHLKKIRENLRKDCD